MEIDYGQLKNTKVADILLVTATEIETNCLLNLFDNVCSDGILVINKDGIKYNLGVFGGYNVVHCQCTNMGTQEVGSSTLTTMNALTDWPCIKCVIMIGIAFGMYNDTDGEEKQNFGDVLVADRIFPYENQRLDPDGNSKYRGKVHYSDNNLVDAFTIVARTWNEKNYNEELTKIKIVPLLTGEKLVDNLEWRNKIKAQNPMYKGGEMEGMGIATASEKAGKPWILVKSICDFADGQKGLEKQLKQESAAKLAACACKKAMQTVNVKSIIGEKLNFFYRDNIDNIDDVFFLAYKKKCSKYYINRDVDKKLEPYILNKHIWITGDSGIGKSDLLRHALVESGVEYVYVDLSICDKNNIDEMFHCIYEEVAEHYKVNFSPFTSFRETIKKLCELLDSKANGEMVYVFVEEIPFEETSDEFSEFVRRYSSLIIYFSNNLKKSKTQLVLSSIAMPKKALETYRDKIKDLVYFETLDKWSNEDCVELIDVLSNAIGLIWENDELKKSFIERYDFSPRKIKTALKECCSLGYRKIDNELFNNENKLK